MYSFTMKINLVNLDYFYRRVLGVQERRVILKYLIQTNNIHAAKGIKVFNNMRDSGVSVKENRCKYKHLFKCNKHFIILFLVPNSQIV